MREHPETGRDDAALLPDPPDACGCPAGESSPSTDPDGVAYCMTCDNEFPRGWEDDTTARIQRTAEVSRSR